MRELTLSDIKTYNKAIVYQCVISARIDKYTNGIEKEAQNHTHALLDN